MNWPRCHPNPSSAARARARRGTAAFTLAEVLAAMLFMAIVIPVAIMGLRLASQTGEVANRKAIAVRVAERVLNEITIAGTGLAAATDGTIREGDLEYRYQLAIEPAGLDTLNLATVQVFYRVQDKEYDVQISTLLNPQ